MWLETVNESAARVSSDLAVNYRVVRQPMLVLGSGRATLRAAGPSVAVAHAFTAHTSLVRVSHGFLLRLRASVFRELPWTADGKEVGFPKESGKALPANGRGRGKTFAFAFPGKRKWTIEFPKAVQYSVTDGRAQNRDDFEILFALPGAQNLAVGKGLDASCKLTPEGGKVQAAARDFHGIGAGSDWVKLDKAEGIRPSSALDFSKLLPRRTPAGVDGVLGVTTNGEFRFARRPDEPLRLFGCQVGVRELFAGKQAAAEYAKVLARMGYNAARLSRFDARLVSEGVKGLRCDADLAANFDQLVAQIGRNGIYSIFDIQSAKDWSWSAIGWAAPGKGTPSKGLVALSFLCDEQAAKGWDMLADAVYGRQNTVTRRRYSEDLSVPLVLAIADTSPFAAWLDIRAIGSLGERYGRWLADKRETDPDFMAKEGVCEALDFRIMPLREKKAASIRRYLAECEVDGIARMKDHLASLKSKALVGAAFSARFYSDVAATRAAAGDFTCDSFHMDSPRNLGARSQPPCRIDNVNPLLAASPISGSIAWHESPGRPMCIMSWNAAAPSSWRAASGLLVGAWASKHGWDALIRDTNPAEDPFAAAAERAVFTLFARGDLASDAPKDAFVIEKGGLTVRTPRTAGGFSPDADGTIVAAPLTARLKGSRAAVWVTSLTDAPIAGSTRLLLTHLTDAQAEGTLFADSRCDLLMRRGTGPCLLRDGSATVELAVEKPTLFKVFALESDGTRTVQIPAEVKGGVLTFEAAIRGDRNAQYLYEIVRSF